MGDSRVYDRWRRTGGGRRVRSAAYGQGKRWQARWRNEAGRQRKQNFDRRLDAERALATVKVDLLRGGYVDPRGGRVTVQTYGEQWRLALGLEVEAVDWLRRTLDVRQQLVTMPGQAPYIAPPKTPASHRTVPLPQVVVDALAAHLAAFGAARVEILDATVKPDPRRRTALLVFTDDAGRPLRRTRFSGIWRPAAAAAELDDGVTFHDLRHYYASLLITYSHLWPDSEDRTREAVDEVLGRVAGEAGAEAAP